MTDIDSYESFRDNNYNEGFKKQRDLTLKERAEQKKLTADKARLAEKNRKERAEKAEAVLKKQEESYAIEDNLKDFAELCKSQGGLKGARMAIARMQSQTSSVSSNKRLCDYLRVEY